MASDAALLTAKFEDGRLELAAGGSWTAGWRWALYVHEACVAAMLVGAGVAVTRARRFGALRDGEPPAPEAREHDLRVHRRAGRVAVAASVLALVMAAAVLAGMYTRAGF